MFAVTAGLGAETKEKQFQASHDDYSSIMFKALADRLAEAFAEALHQRARLDLWGYAPAESLSTDALVAEKYQGIRPAPGYPACPDHSVKKELFELLKADEIGMALTESLAMMSAAFTCATRKAPISASEKSARQRAQSLTHSFATPTRIHALVTNAP